MSELFCRKRLFIEELDSACSSPSVYKKFRRSSSTSPVRFNHSPPVYTNHVDQLKILFPGVEIQLFEKALEESGNNIDSTIKLLHEFRLGNYKYTLDSTVDENATIEKGATITDGDALASKEPQVQNNLPVDGAGWVDLIVSEVTKATRIDDARSRTASILENLEKSISTRASAEATQIYHKENAMLKEQMEFLVRDNGILKRAVAIQHERQKEYNEKNGDVQVQQMKHLLTQYQEQIRTLELNNYALQLQLRWAENSNPIPGSFNPDVY